MPTPLPARRLCGARRQPSGRRHQVRRAPADRQFGDAERGHPLSSTPAIRRLLLSGCTRECGLPDKEHPFGHGRELYFWSFVVAILIFALGGGVSIYEGSRKIREPEPSITSGSTTRPDARLLLRGLVVAHWRPGSSARRRAARAGSRRSAAARIPPSSRCCSRTVPHFWASPSAFAGIALGQLLGPADAGRRGGRCRSAAFCLAVAVFPRRRDAKPAHRPGGHLALAGGARGASIGHSGRRGLRSMPS